MTARQLLSLFVLAASLLPRAATADDVIEYYGLDAFGNVRLITDENGNVIERHDYYPFGEECTTGPCASNPGVGAGQARKFTGKERDAETGLDYFGARYYGSKIGRFTTVDPSLTIQENTLDPQRWNRYVYGRNNPLRFVDPDGRDWLYRRVMGEQYVKEHGDRSSIDVFLGTPSEWHSDLARAKQGYDDQMDVDGQVFGLATMFTPGAKGLRSEFEVGIRPGRLGEPGGPKLGSEGGPGAGKRVPRRQRQEALSENEGNCVFCGQPAREADHAIPRSRGGNTSTGTDGNIQPTCQHCNRQKGAKTSGEYLDWKAKKAEQ